MIRSSFALLFLLALAAPTALAERPAPSPLPGLASSTPADAEAVADLLGFVPGQRHPFHHELAAFYRRLAERSDRVHVERIGRTYGGREQLMLVIGRPDRVAEAGTLRAGRLEASRAGSGPLVIWLGYSVHGDEASGASAAPVVAWHLAMSEAPEVTAWLDEAVVVMEPMVNPDGLDRFAHWVDMHAAANPSADPRDREHRQGWPSGRTSHYWFDLNRDWLPLTHPASRHRIEQYRQWRPHVLTDHHEMGRDDTFFFQPGIPERNNPVTPERVYELTAELARFHARALDEAGEPYFTRESFDDFYLGKGSTYPDLTGGVGILFEQGETLGQRIETPYGERRFADAVANQVRTSLSTLRGSVALADALREHQAGFFREAREEGPAGGWILGDGGDPERARRLLSTLLAHGIEVRELAEETTVSGRPARPGEGWVIPARQDLGRFVEAIFSTPTDLPMTTFYDVSAWPLQHAFDLPLERRRRLPDTGGALTARTLPALPARSLLPGAVAWAVPWDQHNAPAVALALLADGYRVQAAARPLTIETAEGLVPLPRGSLIIHRGLQPDGLEPVPERLAAVGGDRPVRALNLVRGLAASGIDLGSPAAPVLEPPRVALVTGDGTDAYVAGWTWHWFDRLLGRPIVRIDADRVPGDLSAYTHVILPDGSHDRRGDRFAASLARFVRGGGHLVALGEAASWVEKLDLDWSFDDDAVDENAADDVDGEGGETPRVYADWRTDRALDNIGGSALGTRVDATHPLGWGIGRGSLTVFRAGEHVLRAPADPYAAPLRYAEDPLVAGYLADETAKRLAGTPSVAVDRHGRGSVIRIADQPLFRGFWAGTERLLANAVLFAQLVEETGPR